MSEQRKWLGIYSHEEDAKHQSLMAAMTSGWSNIQTTKNEEGFYEVWGVYDSDRKDDHESEHSGPDGQPD